MLGRPADAIDPSKLGRALVVKLRHHGDVLLTSPVFSVLKHHAPGIEIDALVYDDTRDMLTGHPSISTVFTIGRAWRKLAPLERLRLEWRLFQALRARRYDLLIHLSEHPRGAWLARLLGARHAVAPALRNASSWWSASFTHRWALPLNGRRHMVEWNLDALRRIGVQPAPGERTLTLVPGSQAEAEADALLARHGLAPGSFIHLHPASRWTFKCWPAERNAALAAALLQRGERIVITAAPDEAERAFVRDIVSRCGGRIVDLSGQLSLKTLAALSARAKLFVGVDSAPMHIACAMGTPVVALFGPSGENDWGPWSPNAVVIASDRHPCRPCGLDGCGGGKVSDCLVTLPEQRVLSAIDSLLATRIGTPVAVSR
jgi:heptosyltransferase III